MTESPTGIVPKRPRIRRPDFPFALVIWDDAVVSSGDVRTEEIGHKAVRYHSAGWILRQNEVGVSVAAEWAPDEGTWRGVTFIPSGLLIEVRRL